MSGVFAVNAESRNSVSNEVPVKEPSRRGGNQHSYLRKPLVSTLAAIEETRGRLASPNAYRRIFVLFIRGYIELRPHLVGCLRGFGKKKFDKILYILDD
jgi:hypothetical protein